MMYVKGKLPDGSTVITPIADGGIFCSCPVCGKEVTVDYDIFATIVDEGGLEDTAVYCDPCSDDYRAGQQAKKLTRIK